MKVPAIGRADAFFMVLIALTAAMRLRDCWPASRQEIAAVQTLAARNDSARRVVSSRLSGDPELNEGELRHLRERVMAIEALASRPDADARVRSAQSAIATGGVFHRPRGANGAD